MMFENKDRDRYYGVRVGDIVQEHNTTGTVVALGPMDNNRVQVKSAKTGEIVGCVAEWCKILQRVEEWVPGKVWGSVVTNDKTGIPGNTGHSETEYYGGYLVCESVPKHHLPIITAAPDLLKVVKWLHNAMQGDAGRIWVVLREYPGALSWAKEMETALKKANTNEP